MTLSVKHAKVVASSDSGDGKVSSNAWNDEHVLKGTAGQIVGFGDDGLATEIDPATIGGQFIDARTYGVAVDSPDNFTALTLAITAARTAQKPLLLPAGTLTINQAAPTFTLDDNDQIMGMGKGLTTLYFTGLGSTGEVFVATGKSNIRLADFKMEASVLQTSGQVAISLKDCVDCLVEGCAFDKWTNSVIFWTALSTGPVPPQATNCRNKAVNCVSLSSRSYGFYMNFATACEFLNCEAYNASNQDGFKFGGGSMFCKAIGCHAEGNNADGFDTYDGFIASEMTNCTSYNNGANGFQFKGTLGGTYTAGDYVTRESVFSNLVAKGNTLAGFLFQEMRMGAASALLASGNGTSGFVVNNCQGVTFAVSMATRNTQHGWSLIGNTSRCSFSGCSAVDNSYVDGTTQNGTYDGWNINTASNCWFNGCASHNGTQSGKLGGQGYGFNTTTSTGLRFNGGGCTSNVTGAIGGTSPLTNNTFIGFDAAGTVTNTGLLASANNLSDLASVATARANLGLLTVTTQSGTAYTGVLSDAFGFIRFTNASAVTFTVPPNSSVAYPVGAEIYVAQIGAGAVSVAAGAGVTINSPGGILTLSGQYSVGMLKKTASPDTWIFAGDLQAAGNPLTDGDKGDITVSGSGTVFTIDGPIPLSKIATQADQTFLGNVSGSSAVPSALTVADVKAALIPQIQSVTSSATVTPAFTNDQVNITAQAVGLTLANPSGTAVPGKRILIRIKDNGTSQTIAYGTQYRAIGVTLPTATAAGKVHYLGGVWNDTATKLDILAVGQEA